MPKWWDSERHENKHQDAIHDVRLTSGKADMYEQLIIKERKRKVVHVLEKRVSQVLLVETIPSTIPEVSTHTYLQRVEIVSPLFRNILADRLGIGSEPHRVDGKMYPYQTLQILGQKYYRQETVGAQRSGVANRETNKRHMMCMNYDAPQP